MYYNNNFPESFFKKSHSNLTWGTVLLGSVLFFLAIFIFAYPVLIAYFIAAIILFAGLFTLAIGWKLWQFRNAINKLDKLEGETFYNRSSGTDHSHFTYIRW
jgi:predicted membrane protein